MKKVICFVLMLSIFSFSFVSAVDTTQTDVEVTDEEAVENIEEEHGFTNFVDIVNQHTYFFYFQNLEDGTDYIGCFDASWILGKNLIGVLNDIKSNGSTDTELGFLGYSYTVSYYVADSTTKTFELFNEHGNVHIPFGTSEPDVVLSAFSDYRYISNFDLYRSGELFQASNFEAYKASINSGFSEPTTSFIPEGFSVINSVVDCVTSVGENFISPLSTVFYTDNILTFLFVFIFILTLIILIFRSFVNARTR